ncbi:acylsugar acyltransferase 3-like [Solanum pennellii]|uniref:Acylsugar acyltransferase 3-like n=1 Tax=Solanum pennellii TaxID=28526 RepID=A0ABM1FK03_SOLPN|nr:acylsugar acyltransferase 3-like [Solanum pennellii]
MASSKILSRKMIKLLSPTPSSLRQHKLSFMDCINLPQYSPAAFLYPKPKNHTKTQISQILENSLSKVLSSYYPFAGRIKDNNTYVDCDNTGVEYLNVKINCSMSEILNSPSNDVSDIVFQQDLPWCSSLNRSPLVVQLSHFDCGGVAISVCLSHKIVDGYCVAKFISDWATTARHVDFKPSTKFNASTFFPIMEGAPNIMSINTSPQSQRYVSRTYNFSSSNLERLKKSITGVQNPTRVEVATSLIHKCGAIASMKNLGSFKPSLISQVINLRPLIPLDTIGNATCIYSTIATTENEIELSNYVAQIQKVKQQVRNELKNLDTDQIVPYTLGKMKGIVDMMEKDIFDIYLSTSVFNFGLYSKTNFGWGKPIKIINTKYPMKKSIMLFDDPSEEGIDAQITLTEDEMSIFQEDKELLEFASPVVQSTK